MLENFFGAAGAWKPYPQRRIMVITAIGRGIWGRVVTPDKMDELAEDILKMDSQACIV
jgi:hypothetical protein